MIQTTNQINIDHQQMHAIQPIFYGNRLFPTHDFDVFQNSEVTPIFKVNTRRKIPTTIQRVPDGKSPPPYKGSQMCYPLHVYIFLPCLAVRESNTQSSPIDEKHQSSRFAIAIPGRPGLKRCWNKEKCRCFLGDQDYTRFIQRYIQCAPPSVISWFINLINYCYKYHKPELLKL